ncbi:hypothetical protein AX16_000982 [Volvariella volvacea WC 439]|nr:hypothetical protein AX16_000982 [Volvariella volvacea WC 439]
MHRRRIGAHRSSTAPVGSFVPPSTSPQLHPRALVPGIAPTSTAKHDFFFTNTPFQPPPPPVPPLPPIQPTQYPQSYPSFLAPHLIPAHQPTPPPPVPPPPLLHRSTISGVTPTPPIPPKPHLARYTTVLPVVDAPNPSHIPLVHTQETGAYQPAQLPDEEEDALATALALSQSEAEEQKAHLKALKDQEEQDLARALQESLSMQPNRSVVYSSTSSTTSHPLTVTTASTSKNVESSPIELRRHDTWRAANPQSSNQVLNGTQQGSNNKGKGPDSDDIKADFAYLSSKTYPVQGRPPTVGLPQVSLQDDEALARRLAAEDVASFNSNEPAAQSILGGHLSDTPVTSSPVNNPANLPLYSPLNVTQALPKSDPLVEHPIQSGKLTPNPDEKSPKAPQMLAPPAYTDSVSIPPGPRPMSRVPSAVDLKEKSSLMVQNPTGSASSEVPSDVLLSTLAPDGAPPTGSSNTDSMNAQVARPSLAHRASLLPLGEVDDDSVPVVPTAVNVNQFVDPELLMGVSIGFAPPTLSSEIVPMQGIMPNIVSLPHGRSLPLHLQAPGWRQMLKMLARHSGSRLEPTVEAMAQNRGADFKLRTVIQFVKPHQLSLHWRTILWLTLDHAIPPEQSIPKYTNGDPNVLPYSYTLSSLPALLRDGSDTSISKIFTVPATSAVPYPALPITFPNLALYLQAVLDESRRFMSDSSSGVRKLAKMVDSCYPAVKGESDLTDDTPERSGGVGGLFKRVMGRGNKPKKGRGNDETYDLVTPFVPDEWG